MTEERTSAERHGLLVSSALCLCLIWASDRATAQEQAQVDGDRAGIAIQHDDETFVTTISVRAKDGRVSWEDLLRAAARAKKFDDAALEGSLPDLRISITGKPCTLLLDGMNRVLAPGIQFQVVMPEKDGDEEPVLAMRLDRAALLASRRRFKRRIREAFRDTAKVLTNTEGRAFGIERKNDWAKADPKQNILILVHGLHSVPEIFDPLMGDLEKRRLPIGSFRYPNDQPIVDSARMLSKELQGIKKDHPNRQVTVLTSSMGGLVARAAMEDKELDPGNVDRLIMVCPPTHGSSLARFAFALEIWEHLVVETERNPVKRLYQAIEDGLGEAARDLRPGSVFLQKLNARDRNPKVTYTLILGSGGLLDSAAVDRLRKGVMDAGEDNRFIRFFGKKIDGYLGDLDELVKGRGDGAVSVQRGKLKGVKDTIVLGFDHLSMFNQDGSTELQALRDIILDRVCNSRHASKSENVQKK